MYIYNICIYIICIYIYIICIYIYITSNPRIVLNVSFLCKPLLLCALAHSRIPKAVKHCQKSTRNSKHYPYLRSIRHAAWCFLEASLGKAHFLGTPYQATWHVKDTQWCAAKHQGNCGKRVHRVGTASFNCMPRS